MKTISVVTHYDEEDVECIGDYCEIEIFIDGKLAVTYGDGYHDNGRHKEEGFISGFLYAKPEYKKVKINRFDVSDFAS